MIENNNNSKIEVDSILEKPTEQNPNEPIGHASMFSTIFNLAKTIIGSGTLSIPLAFYYSGYIGGTLLLILAWALSAFGMHLLTYAAITR